MNNINKFALVLAMSLVSFSSFAQTVSLRALTIDDAEAKLAEQAKKFGASYKITATHFNNGVYMVARLTK